MNEITSDELIRESMLQVNDLIVGHEANIKAHELEREANAHDCLSRPGEDEIHFYRDRKLLQKIRLEQSKIALLTEKQKELEFSIDTMKEVAMAE